MAISTSMGAEVNPPGGMVAGTGSMDRRAVVQSVWYCLTHLSSNQTSTVVGVTGRAGSGLSEVLRQVQTQTLPGWRTTGICAAEGVWDFPGRVARQVVEVSGFSAWDRRTTHAYLRMVTAPAGRSQVAATLMAAAWGRAYGLSSRFGSRPQGGLSGFDLMAAATQSAWAQAAEPLVVCIDGLDRLPLPELQSTLRFLAGPARLPQVFYVVALNYEAVLNSLSTVPELGSVAAAWAEVSRAICSMVSVPPVRAESRWQLWLDACVVAAPQLNPPMLARSYDVWRLVEPFLDTPRAVHQLAQAFGAIWDQVAGEIDVADVLLLTTLRLFEPRLYEQVVTYRGVFTGVEKDVDCQQRITWVQDLVSALAIGHAPASQAIVEWLFPLTDAQGRPHGHRQSVADPRYLDRYIQGQVPDDDLGDVTIALALQQLSEESHGLQAARLLAALNDNPALVLTRMADISVSAPNPLPLLRALNPQYRRSKEYHDMEVRDLAVRLVAGVGSPTLAAECISVLLQDEDCTVLAVDVVREARAQRMSWAADVTPFAVTRIRDVVRSEMCSEITVDSRSTVYPLLGALAEFEGESAVPQLLWGTLASPDCYWRIDDVLALFVPLGYGVDVFREDFVADCARYVGISALVEHWGDDYVVDRSLLVPATTMQQAVSVAVALAVENLQIVATSAPSVRAVVPPATVDHLTLSGVAALPDFLAETGGTVEPVRVSAPRVEQVEGQLGIEGGGPDLAEMTVVPERVADESEADLSAPSVPEPVDPTESEQPQAPAISLAATPDYLRPPPLPVMVAIPLQVPSSRAESAAGDRRSLLQPPPLPVVGAARSTLDLALGDPKLTALLWRSVAAVQSDLPIPVDAESVGTDPARPVDGEPHPLSGDVCTQRVAFTLAASD